MRYDQLNLIPIVNNIIGIINDINQTTIADISENGACHGLSVMYMLNPQHLKNMIEKINAYEDGDDIDEQMIEFVSKLSIIASEENSSLDTLNEVRKTLLDNSVEFANATAIDASSEQALINKFKTLIKSDGHYLVDALRHTMTVKVESGQCFLYNSNNKVWEMPFESVEALASYLYQQFTNDISDYIKYKNHNQEMRELVKSESRELILNVKQYNLHCDKNSQKILGILENIGVSTDDSVINNLLADYHLGKISTHALIGCAYQHITSEFDSANKIGLNTLSDFFDLSADFFTKNKSLLELYSLNEGYNYFLDEKKDAFRSDCLGRNLVQLYIDNCNSIAINQVIDKGGDNIFSIKDTDGCTMLGYSNVVNHWFSTKTLLSAMTEDEINQPIDRNRNTCLHILASINADNSRLFQLYLDYKADPTLKNRSHGWDVLQFAITNGHWNCARILVNNNFNIDLNRFIQVNVYCAKNRDFGENAIKFINDLITNTEGACVTEKGFEVAIFGAEKSGCAKIVQELIASPYVELNLNHKGKVFTLAMQLKDFKLLTTLIEHLTEDDILSYSTSQQNIKMFDQKNAPVFQQLINFIDDSIVNNQTNLERLTEIKQFLEEPAVNKVLTGKKIYASKYDGLMNKVDENINQCHDVDNPDAMNFKS